jgi:hypothetical protein
MSEAANLEAVDVEVIDESVVLPVDLQVDPQEAEELKKKVHDCIVNLSVSYFELSKYLGEIQRKKLYKAWGYPSVQEWVTNEYKFQRRKAYYLVRIDEYFNNSLPEKLPEDLYEETLSAAKDIGWSKASVIASQNVLNEQNCREVMQAARDLTVEALTEKCKSIKDAMREGIDASDDEEDRPPNLMKMVTKSFKFSEYDKEIIDAALERAKEMLGDSKTKDGKALSFICSDFEANSGVDIADHLSKLERLLGISVIAISDSSQKIVFGKESLERLAAADQE